MAVPERIGRFVVEERIGGGAFASVWRAHDEALESAVAIKVLSENWLDSMDVRGRFLAEAKLLRRGESDRVVRVHDLGELSDGRPYLVMTYADKGTLAARVKDAPLPWREGVQVAMEVARALRGLHNAGVLHRDIKPSNILFRSRPDGREQLLLGDLGLGKLLSEASVLTLAGGTPAYMAPEQARPGAPVSVRTDLYAVGAMLYRVITGTHPHEATDFPAIADPSRAAPRPPSTLVQDIPPALDALILRAMANEPEDRHSSAGELVSELRAVLTVSDTSASATLPTSGQAATDVIDHPAKAATPPRGTSVDSSTIRTHRPLPPPQTQPPPYHPRTQSRQQSQPLPPPRVSTTPPRYATQQPKPRRRWIPAAAIVSVLVLGGGAAGVYYLTRPPNVEVASTDSTVRLTVPRDWAKQSSGSQGWDPSALGLTDGKQPALVVAPEVSRFADTGAADPGAFAGVLPAGTALDATAFEAKVAKGGCAPFTSQRPADTVAARGQKCGSVLITDLLLQRGGRLVWLQLKQLNEDFAQVRQVTSSVSVK
ncbi:serine/threonine protein kinase [Herbihabitans rhizosphaerae]|uniref:non-specific serine/threonine protein kinase n=1 Tax=Herbihabitans rhizosphaerae TaxID=1872711 RepID=A0A4Q7KVL7_9PSEU|nr:serine/threonine-protein kinase [Herbihabitans rhizosphaerae]RZS41088.1 serine/threonine protein kinase [Herbihabitans rhizosphaerae]